MRLILTTIALMLSVSPGWGIDNESLYKSCQKYVNSGFDIGRAENKIDVLDHTVCFGYIMGVVESYRTICVVNQTVNKNSDIKDYWDFTAMSFGTSARNDDINAVIQSFINWARDNPQKWKQTPFAHEWLLEKWPCDAN